MLPFKLAQKADSTILSDKRIILSGGNAFGQIRIRDGNTSRMLEGE